MSKVLILVLSCQHHRESRQAAVAATWARRLQPGQRLLFVEGGHVESVIEGNRLLLEVPDGYDDLALKSFEAYRFCHDNLVFDGILKCDDDTYLECGRLAASIEVLGDYSGNPARDQAHFPPYARGGCYWISRRSVAAIVADPYHAHKEAPWYKGNARMRRLGEKDYRETVAIEDVMVGDLLARAGIPLLEDHRFHHYLRPTLWQDRTLISNHYVRPEWMYRLERQRTWPVTPWYRFRMWLASLLPSANPPR